MSGDLIRPRRLRRTPALRDMVAETHVQAGQLMLPYFVIPGTGQRTAIDAMPGISRTSIDELLRDVEHDLRLGIRQILLFGVPPSSDKDAVGSKSSEPHGLVPQAVRALRGAFGADLLIATDVCLCPYTTHGHCGVLKDGEVLNDPSLPLLADMALAHAQAGADIVAPSDMMDGRVGALRRRLDEQGWSQTSIMSYSIKYASGYYGPFREAASSAPGQGDRKGYQMDPRNVREGLREAMLDTQEGADILMVKPALAYLDVIAAVRRNSRLPLACYNVSGEYSMVKLAAKNQLIDERTVVLENLTAMRRAGADIIITYHARDVLGGGWL